MLARSLLASTRALVPPARPGEPRFFDGAHGVSPAAYAARLGPTDGGATNSTYDASPGYLQSRRAAADVAAAAPSARVLLAVCDPATRLWDAYHGGRAEAAAARRGAPQPEGAIATTVYDLPFPDFVAAVRGAQPQHAGVWDAGLYGRHVRLWAAAVGADRLFLWNRGDYAAAPAATTRTLLAFLRLPPAPGADLDVVVPGAELPQDGAADGGGGGGGGQPRPPPMDAAARDLVAPLYAASWAALLA